ncbi:hypothetical protein SCLCIDRAFT_1214927 [Scleroderma citrinum Foug A]|uniref:Uncharacterized protein n=1 Tax=Scleroderma citrinum Foug A TaxID=1036808 RepID=A0A0C3E3F6_9AGAM|nr:hypothetical protein SCLCIDRAFT_1214927 [Scleroderma citrinum Foug A]
MISIPLFSYILVLPLHSVNNVRREIGRNRAGLRFFVKSRTPCRTGSTAPVRDAQRSARMLFTLR